MEQRPRRAKRISDSKGPGLAGLIVGLLRVRPTVEMVAAAAAEVEDPGGAARAIRQLLWVLTRYEQALEEVEGGRRRRMAQEG
jgi:hypothetical protein